MVNIREDEGRSALEVNDVKAIEEKDSLTTTASKSSSMVVEGVSNTSTHTLDGVNSHDKFDKLMLDELELSLGGLEGLGEENEMAQSVLREMDEIDAYDGHDDKDDDGIDIVPGDTQEGLGLGLGLGHEGENDMSDVRLKDKVKGKNTNRMDGREDRTMQNEGNMRNDNENNDKNQNHENNNDNSNRNDGRNHLNVRVCADEDDDTEVSSTTDIRTVESVTTTSVTSTSLYHSHTNRSNQSTSPLPLDIHDIGAPSPLRQILSMPALRSSSDSDMKGVVGVGVVGVGVTGIVSDDDLQVIPAPSPIRNNEDESTNTIESLYQNQLESKIVTGFKIQGGKTQPSSPTRNTDDIACTSTSTSHLTFNAITLEGGSDKKEAIDHNPNPNRVSVLAAEATAAVSSQISTTESFATSSNSNNSVSNNNIIHTRGTVEPTTGMTNANPTLTTTVSTIPLTPSLPLSQVASHPSIPTKRNVHPVPVPVEKENRRLSRGLNRSFMSQDHLNYAQSPGRESIRDRLSVRDSSNDRGGRYNHNHRQSLSLASTSHGNTNNANHSTRNNRKGRSIGASLWTVMKQQVFLGMAATSVPVKPHIPRFVEDLDQAGIRFVFFSPRNMRRSKKLADKIGLQTDWNCAISLRDLDAETEKHDPHRAISNYGDWDVKARMPHGVEAIKKHLKEVDNVPLLVSLYTDATASTTQSMVDIFRDYGEVVLTVGSGYRTQNSSVFSTSNAAVSIFSLPGQPCGLPIDASKVYKAFPDSSSTSLIQADILLSDRLISLGTLPLLQMNINKRFGSTYSNNNKNDDNENNEDDDDDDDDGSYGLPAEEPQIRLSVILQAIRSGRVLLNNTTQMCAYAAVVSIGLASWVIASIMIPTNTSHTPSNTSNTSHNPTYASSLIDIPVPSALMILIFTTIHLPVILLSFFFSKGRPQDEVMSQMPLKTVAMKRPKEEMRYTYYLALRVGWIGISCIILGWIIRLFIWNTSANSNSYNNTSSNNNSSTDNNNDDRISKTSEVIGDNCMLIMSVHMLIMLCAEASTLLHRGMSMKDLPSWTSHPVFYIAIIVCLIIHMTILIYLYPLQIWVLCSDWSKLSTIIICSLLLCALDIALGVIINGHDFPIYQRHQRFLRLDFDTRLGMHSPK